MTHVQSCDPPSIRHPPTLPPPPKTRQMRGFVTPGDLVVVVSDLRPHEQDIVRSVQVRRVR